MTIAKKYNDPESDKMGKLLADNQAPGTETATIDLAQLKSTLTKIR